MTVPKWFVVARNEYRIRTSRIRRIRPYFPYLLIGLLAVYLTFVAPAIVSLFIDQFRALILSQASAATMQIMLFLVFVYFIIIPIISTFREEQTGQLEVLHAAPVKPGDVLLGEFLGQLPFYAIFITVIIGTFTAVLSPLGLNMIQIAITIIVFLIIALTAFWIGSVIAALLRTKLGKTARGKDMGRALAMILSLPLVALVYALQFGGLIEALADPGASRIVRIIFDLLPSSWGAEVVAGFASNPGNISAVLVGTLSRCAGLVALFIAVLWLGAKVANRSYSLESSLFSGSRIKPDGPLYKTVKRLGGGGAFGNLLTAIFKDYSRRLENLTNISYVIGLLLLMLIFIAPNISAGPDDPPFPLVIPYFVFPLLAVMATGDAIVRGKGTLFLYRKAPSGERRLVRAELLKGWLITVPIAGVLAAVITAVGTEAALFTLVANVGLMMLFVFGYTGFALGLSLLNPAFSVRSVRLWANVMIAVFVSIGIFASSMLILAKLARLSDPGEQGLLYLQSLQTGLSGLTGILFLYLGKRRLSRIE